MHTLWIVIVFLAVTGLVAALVIKCRQDESTPHVSIEPSDSSKRASLLAKIERLVAQGRGEVAVSLEDFFEGNEDLGSIGPNLGSEQPPIRVFYETLLGVRERDDVQDVLVRISDYQELEWPFTDAVWILTSAPASSVQEWVEALLPDEVAAGWGYDRPVEAPELHEGIEPVWVWWD